MQYVYEKNGEHRYPVSFGQFLAENPDLNVSFANSPESESLKDFGLHVPEDAPEPSYNDLTHKTEVSVVKAGGKYRKRWNIVVLSEEEKSVKNTRKAQEVRSERAVLLAQYVDNMNPVRWEAMSEPSKQKWREYRQALLDVPQQAGFPWNVVWPVVPGE